MLINQYLLYKLLRIIQVSKKVLVIKKAIDKISIYGKKKMRAITYQGIKSVEVKDVSDPKIENSDDIIIVTSTAICGSDLHLIHGMIPNTPKDYIIGHETMGIVEEIGKDVKKVKRDNCIKVILKS